MWSRMVVALALAHPAFSQEEGFVSLSDSPDLAGWRKTPGWTCRDGIIRGDGRGGSLFSEAMYEDFTLRLEFRIPKGGNSGIYLRAPITGRQSALGMELQVVGDWGRAPHRGGCGAIYDARAPDVYAANPPGEWNSVEISLLGRHLRAVMNGRVIHDISLDAPEVNASLPEGRKLRQRAHRGYIGLQTHGSAVEYRNVRVKAEPEAGFKALFANGLAGWSGGDAGGFSVAEGVLTCVAPEGGAALLTSDAVWSDYDLRLEYRVERGARAGICLRTDQRARDRYTPVEVLLADDSGRPPGLECAGALIGAAGVVRRCSRPAGQWNDLEILCRGRLVTVYLNGVRVVDANTDLWGQYIRAPLKGRLQLHAIAGRVQLRDVRLRSITN